MKLEQQVVSLELAKELKEVGYKQEGIWWWAIYEDSGELGNIKYISSLKGDFEDVIVAPTVAELGERLPKPCYCDNYNSEEGWSCGCTIQERVYEKTDKSEANVRAKMWLYLKKEKLI